MNKKKFYFMFKKRHNRDKKITEQNRAPSRSTTKAINPLASSSRMSSSRNNMSRNNISSLSATSRLSGTMSSRTTEKHPMKSLDELSVASTNLSLLSVASTEKSLPLFRTYGKFNYFSYYEKFMDMRSKHRIPRHLMPEFVFHFWLFYK